MKKEFYIQTEIRKQINDKEFLVDIAWLPEKFAQINKEIKIKINGKWNCGWKVIKTYSKIELEQLSKSDRDYINQRKVSDI